MKTKEVDQPDLTYTLSSKSYKIILQLMTDDDLKALFQFCSRTLKDGLYTFVILCMPSSDANTLEGKSTCSYDSNNTCLPKKEIC